MDQLEIMAWTMTIILYSLNLGLVLRGKKVLFDFHQWTAPVAVYYIVINLIVIFK